MSTLFNRFRSTLASVSEAEIRADVTLGNRLVLSEAGPITVSYAPFEHIQHSARLVIIGITPGAQQAKNALIAARREILAGADDQKALAAAKVHASFSGAMRTNLVALLDYVRIPHWMGIQSTATLWGEHSHFVHFTSAL